MPSYLDAKALAWFGACSIFVLMCAALVVMGTESVPVLTVGIPILGVLVTAYTGIDRYVSGRQP